MAAFKESDFEFVNGISKKGNEILYIKFNSTDLRITSDDFKNLKDICKGYFFYTKTEKCYGFLDVDNNRLDVSRYLLFNEMPDWIITKAKSVIIGNRALHTVDLSNTEVNFIEISGRPLFYVDRINSETIVYINLNHSFFVRKDVSEKEIVKKFVLSFILAKNDFTGSAINSFESKLHMYQSEIGELL